MIISSTNKISDGATVTPLWVGHLLNSIAARIRTATAHALGPLGISPPQLRALEAIASGQPLSQTRLGEAVAIDRSTIVHVVDHFEALGLASREPDPADRRSHAVVLTKKGARVLAAARNCALDVESEFLSPLSRSERETLRALLRKLFEPSPCPEEKKNEPRTPPPHPR